MAVTARGAAAVQAVGMDAIDWAAQSTSAAAAHLAARRGLLVDALLFPDAIDACESGEGGGEAVFWGCSTMLVREP